MIWWFSLCFYKLLDDFDDFDDDDDDDDDDDGDDDDDVKRHDEQQPAGRR